MVTASPPRAVASDLRGAEIWKEGKEGGEISVGEFTLEIGRAHV